MKKYVILCRFSVIISLVLNDVLSNIKSNLVDRGLFYINETFFHLCNIYIFQKDKLGGEIMQQRSIGLAIVLHF